MIIPTETILLMMEKQIILILEDESEDIAARLLAVKDWAIRNQMYTLIQELSSTGKLSPYELNLIHLRLILFAPFYSILKRGIRLNDAPLISSIVVWFIAVPISVLGPSIIEKLYEKVDHTVKKSLPIIKVVSALTVAYSIIIFTFYNLLVFLNS